MFSSRSAFQRFADIISGPEQRIRLAEAALVIASEFRRDVNVDEYLGWLDKTAAEFPAGPDLNAIGHYFAEHLGFNGDTDGYYDPSNNLLDQVIERRLGIPITLSIILMELGAPKAWQLEGVGFPGHFMVRDTSSKMY